MNRFPLLSATRASWIFAITSLAALGVTGCVPRPHARRTPSTTASWAAREVREGHYLKGSQAYQHLAHRTTGARRARYTLKAANALVHAGALAQAHHALASVKGPLSGPLQAREDVLNAEINAALGAPQRALKETEQAQRIRGLRPRLLAEIDRVQAQAAMSLQHATLAARDLIGRERLLVSRRRLAHNETALWHALAGLSTEKLRRLDARQPTTALGAWAGLEILVKRTPPRSQRRKRAVHIWQRHHPREPLTSTFLRRLLRGRTRPQRGPRSIALLLPLSSPFSKAAKAVERGFVDMAREAPAGARPTILVYDIGSDAKQASHYYQEAVQRGAQFIVGPLGADAVRNVAQHARFRVPTLLLGLAPHGLAHDPSSVPVYQYSLARTEEARQAADRAYLDGHSRAAILYPRSAFGKRMLHAFARRWRHLGGLVVSQAAYTPGAAQYVRPVEKLLNITESRAREQRLQDILPMPLAFTARRRQDIGFVFLVADAPDGRLIKPQLDYDHADTLPVYSTSTIFTGRPDPVYDRDLDGIMFGDMPWMLVGNGRMARLRRSLPHAQRYDFSPLARLYAFGADAESLVGRLNRLSLGGGSRYNGLTGILSLRRDNIIRRQLVWAQFQKGLPILIDKFLPYRGLFSRKTGTH